MLNEDRWAYQIDRTDFIRKNALKKLNVMDINHPNKAELIKDTAKTKPVKKPTYRYRAP